ncbi:MAG: hypothetical protein DI539_30925 [Flavobacterium psychrophilum]|nr:MAG: hypothetical protein DI539_30925 [Flavobacterium psychrophilum]
MQPFSDITRRATTGFVGIEALSAARHHTEKFEMGKDVGKSDVLKAMDCMVSRFFVGRFDV